MSVLVGARGSWEIDRRGGARSSEEGVDKRDCKSGGGGDDEDDAERRAFTTVVVVLGSFTSARINMKLREGHLVTDRVGHHVDFLFVFLYVYECFDYHHSVQQ